MENKIIKVEDGVEPIKVKVEVSKESKDKINTKDEVKKVEIEATKYMTMPRKKIEKVEMETLYLLMDKIIRCKRNLFDPGIRVDYTFFFFKRLTICERAKYKYDGKDMPYLILQMLEESKLKYTKLCKELELYSIYDHKLGYYKSTDPEALRQIIYYEARKKGIVLKPLEVNEAFNFFCLHKSEPPEQIKPDCNKICFKNGILDQTTGQFISHNIDTFITSHLLFDYDPSAKTEHWFDYLNDLCNGDKEKIKFLRCWLKLVIISNNETQTFLYIVGKGGTGKSIFGKVASLLVGEGKNLATSLKHMNNDRFEAVNLRDKTLVTISNTDNFSGNIAILKQMTGGDVIKGRIKLVQGAFDISFEGNILIVGNYLLGSEDTSGALQRRIRVLEANNVIKPEKQLNLLNYLRGEWSGLLLNDLSGIFNWIFQQDLEEAKYYVKTHLVNTSEINNPLKQWCHECLQKVGKSSGSYLGVKMGSNQNELIEAQRRGLLYPFYEQWCIRRDYVPIKHNKFSTELLNQFDSSSGVSIVKRNQGKFILGLKLKDEVGTKDNNYAGPLIIDNEKNSTIDNEIESIEKKLL